VLENKEYTFLSVEIIYLLPSRLVSTWMKFVRN